MTVQWSAWPGYRAGHRWSRGSVDDDVAGFERYSRPLGLLESGFDVGAQRQGQSDIHALLCVDLEPSPSTSEADDEALRLNWSNRFLERVWHSWARLRVRHPLLAARIRTGGQETIPGVAAREFVHDEPISDASALAAAHPTVLLHEFQSDEHTLEQACEQLLDDHVLNGERTLLDQGECLARLILVRDPIDPLKLGLALNVAHVVRLAELLWLSRYAEWWRTRAHRFRVAMDRLAMPCPHSAFCATCFRMSRLVHSRRLHTARPSSALSPIIWLERPALPPSWPSHLVLLGPQPNPLFRSRTKSTTPLSR